MADNPEVVLTGFADEAAIGKTADQQFAAFAALGLQYYSIRFIDLGNGIKNVMKLTKSEFSRLRHLQDDYGLNVSSVGSPIGKVKLLDVDDGTQNALRTIQTLPEPRRQQGLRHCSRARDEADSRLLVLSPARHRPGRAYPSSGRPAWSDCGDLSPQRSNFWLGGRGESGGSNRADSGRDPS